MVIVTDVKWKNKKGDLKQGFKLDGYLAENFQKVPEFLKKDFDLVGIISGRGKVRTGKTLKKGSKVLMSDGNWKNVEDIRIGDKVISPGIDNLSSTIEEVLKIHNRFEKDCYDIVEEKRGKILYSCSGNHDLPVFKLNTRKNKYEHEIIEAKELSIFSKKCHNKFYCFSSPTIEFKSIEPTINPYCLGAWIGDGHFSGDIGITSADFEIINEFKKNYKIMSEWPKKDTKAVTYRISIKNDFSKELIKYGYKNTNSGKKFIPKECLKASVSFRMNLLAGLIDTDGYASERDNSIEYVTKSEELSKDIKSLVFSLGGRARVKKVKKSIKKINFVGDYFLIKISFSNPTIIPLRLIRKKKNLKKTSFNRQKVYIQAKKSSSSEVFGFEISGKSKLHITDNWIVTHNSTIAAQVGYYCAWLIAGGVMDLSRHEDTGKFLYSNKIIKKPDKPLNYSLDNLAFSPEDLMRLGRALKKNSVIIYDEGRTGLDAKTTMTSLNRMLEDFFQECGQYNHVILIVLPDFFKLHADYAVSRSYFLIDVLLDESFNRGYFNFYNETQKDFLYNHGKKKLGIIARYGAGYPSFSGNFTKWFPFNKEKYDSLKRLALKKKEIGSRRTKIKEQRDALMSMYKDEAQETLVGVAEKMSVALGKTIGRDVVDHGIQDYRIYLEKKEEYDKLVEEQNEYDNFNEKEK